MVLKWFKKLTRTRERERVAPYLTEGLCLDVGCGSRSSTNNFRRAIGIELRPGPAVDALASVYQLPFGDQTFDMVLLLNVLEHLAEPQLALDEILRVLKPAGRLLISVPFTYPLHHHPMDYYRYAPNGLRHLLRGYQEVVVEPLMNSTETLAVLLERFFVQTRYSKPTRFLCYLLSRLLWRIPSHPARECPGYPDSRSNAEVLPFLCGGFLVVANRGAEQYESTPLQ